MAIAQLVQYQRKRIVILGLIALLAACGGGGGGGDKKDSTPDTFSFTAVTNAAVTVEVTSTPITIAGINKEAAITIANGTYSVNDGAFVATPGTVTVGQTVKVKLSTAATTNTAKVATLTVGGTVGTFSVTTAPDITPNALVFTPTAAAALSSVNSSTITIAGFDGALPISISAGGEYQIGSGAFTAAAGTATSGQVVTVRATASASVSTAVSVTLTLGAVTGTYTVTTIPDTIAPTAQIMFPPAVSLSNGAVVKVRGTASDVNSAIASVTVNGVAAVSTDNFATWTADVPLTLGANTLTVAATDSAANASADAAHVNVRRVASLAGVHFPDANVPFSDVWGMVLDSIRNRLLVLDTSQGVVAVNLTTGARTVLSGAGMPDAGNLFVRPWDIALDTINTNRVFVSDYGSSLGLGAIIAVDLTSGAQSMISNASTPNAGASFTDLTGIAFDNVNHRILVADDVAQAVFTVNQNTGARVLLSATTNSSQGAPFTYPSGIALDGAHNRALVVDFTDNAVIAVNLDTGVRSLLSNNTTPNVNAAFNSPNVIVMDSENNRALVSVLNTIVSVDLTTGQSTNIFPAISDISPFGLSWDAVHKIALVSDANLDTIFALDSITGEQVIISK